MIGTKSFVIGLCGGSGSGKTTLARKLKENLGDQAVLISMDSFYKERHDLTYEERTKINYDHPDAFDADIMFDCVSRLKNGEAVDIPVYDFTVHDRAEGTEHIEPAPVIFLDGILLFNFSELVELMDLKVYVDTDADLRILRRVLRDSRERARSVDSIVSQYIETVRPMHEKYVEPTKNLADIIVPEGGFNSVACEVILAAIRHRVGI